MCRVQKVIYPKISLIFSDLSLKIFLIKIIEQYTEINFESFKIRNES